MTSTASAGSLSPPAAPPQVIVTFEGKGGKRAYGRTKLQSLDYHKALLLFCSDFAPEYAQLNGPPPLQLRAVFVGSGAQLSNDEPVVLSSHGWAEMMGSVERIEVTLIRSPGGSIINGALSLVMGVAKRLQ